MTYRALGASVRGPAHLASGAANEDAWGARTAPDDALAVVCDGMGSRPRAREGAATAVRAARAAWRHWRRSPTARPEDYIRLLEVLWRVGLQDVRPEDASTTCLVCGARRSGGGFIARLGDGVAALRRPDGALQVVGDERDAVGTLTTGLGVPHGLKDWDIHSFPALEAGSAVLLATDGVADDLLPERRADFIAWLVDDIAAAERPRHELARALRSWPVPHHRDDKTVLVLWNPMTSET